MTGRLRNHSGDAVALAQWIQANDGVFGDRYELTTETGCLDGEHRFSLHLRDRETPWVQTAVRIFISENDRHELFSAFGIDALRVAMREDLAPQRHAVEAMESVLRMCIGHSSELLIRCLHADWKVTQDRLERCWQEIAGGGELAPNAFCILQHRHWNWLALEARTTGMSSGEWFRVEWRDDKNAYVRSTNAGTSASMTQASLSSMTHLSGHAKLEILSGKPGAEYTRARLAFDHERTRGAGQRTVKPVRGIGSALIKETKGKLDTFLAFPDGRSARLTQRSDLHVISISSNFIHGAAAAFELSCGQHRPLFIQREHGFASHPFASTEQLDDLMRILLSVILGNDDPLSDELLPPNADPFDPMHPLLAGITVPPRHRAFIGSMLGDPYRRARERAERFTNVKAGKRAREAMKAEDDRLLEEAKAGAKAKAIQNLWVIPRVSRCRASGTRCAHPNQDHSSTLKPPQDVREHLET